MSNANEQAFPRMVEMNWYESTERYQVENQGGLTKLEYFAGLAMQGLCLTASLKYDKGECNAAIAERAVVLALALLAELEKEKGV
jgi:hypothetical protein